MKAKIWRRQAAICPLCLHYIHELRPAQLDHIVPVSAGGSADEDNFQVVHYKCNNEKGNSSGYASRHDFERPPLDEVFAAHVSHWTPLSEGFDGPCADPDNFGGFRFVRPCFAPRERPSLEHLVEHLDEDDNPIMHAGFLVGMALTIDRSLRPTTKQVGWTLAWHAVTGTQVDLQTVRAQMDMPSRTFARAKRALIEAGYLVETESGAWSLPLIEDTRRAALTSTDDTSAILRKFKQELLPDLDPPGGYYGPLREIYVSGADQAGVYS